MPLTELQLSRDALTALAAAGVLFGILQCCCGYRVWRFVLAVNGLVYGMCLGLVVAALLRPSDASTVLALQVGGAVLLAVLCAAAKPLGTFLVGAGLGAGAVAMAASAFGRVGGTDQGALIAATCLIGLVAGIVFAVAGRSGVVILSSINGAAVAVSGAFALVQMSGGRVPTAALETDKLQLVLMGGAALVGMLIQFGMTARNVAPAVASPKGTGGGTVEREASGGISACSAAASPPGVDSRIAQLDALRASGTISASEYDQQRERIVGTGGTASGHSQAGLVAQEELQRLRSELEREKARSSELASSRDHELRELRGEVNRVRDEQERGSAGRVVGGIISLIVFALIAWWFLAGQGGEELRRYLIWKDTFGRFFGR